MIGTIFSPSFGNRPNEMVGRKQVVHEVITKLQSAPGSHDRAMILFGQRGSGKTVLLWEIADRAKELNYIVATPTVAFDGMLVRIIEKIQDDIHVRFLAPFTQSIDSTVCRSLSLGNFQSIYNIQETGMPQHTLIQIARQLTIRNKGLLILIDELQANSREIKQFIATYQEMVKEGLNIAIIMAGLTGATSTNLQGSMPIFFNKIKHINLEPLTISDIDDYFERSFGELSIPIPPSLRISASLAVKGSPYLLQLIGHGIVIRSNESKGIDTREMKNAIFAAIKEYKEDVCKPTLAALSDTDVLFLQALAEIGSPAKMSEIIQSLERSNDYVQKYCLRLLKVGIIESPKRGYVSIAIPYLESYLKERHE